MIAWVLRNIINPVWDYKDNSVRLKELQSLDNSQWKSIEDMRKQQLEDLREIIRYAYSHCDYYRSLFDSNRINAHLDNFDDLNKIPLLTKDIIRSNTPEMISDEFRVEELISAKTGGSTGKALHVYHDKVWQERRTADALKCDAWAGYQLGMKVAAIWGNPPRNESIKEKIRNYFIDRVIALDTMSMTDRSMSNFVKEWRKFSPDIVFGHSHSIYIFAKYLLENNITDMRPIGIISTSMMLISEERKAIEDAFGCKVTDRYGCEEVGLIACECEAHNGMHMVTEQAYVEFLNEDGNPAKEGELAKIVVTDLCNKGMPFIRYMVEDVGIYSNRKCSCGREYPIMEKVIGRVADFLTKKDGTLVAGVSIVERTLTAIDGIEQMQIVQEEVDRIIVNYVKSTDHTSDTLKLLEDEMESIFGPDVSFEYRMVELIEQDPSGKYRFAINNING